MRTEKDIEFDIRRMRVVPKPRRLFRPKTELVSVCRMHVPKAALSLSNPFRGFFS